MVDPTWLKALINQRVTKILLVAQAALPECQFKAYRKYVLDEFGRNGLETELDRIGTGRNISSKKGVHHE